MAQRSGGRALGASAEWAGIGGMMAHLRGAVLPVVEPFVLSFSPIEFFWLAIIGITSSRRWPAKCWCRVSIVGCFGC